MKLTVLADQISSMRGFNRFYTTRLGILRKRHFNDELSLTEARVLYEIASTPNLTASSLCSTLELDRGYISRLLSGLAKRQLVRQRASKKDGREKLLTLSAAGEKKMAQLNRESAKQIQDLIEPLGTNERNALIQSVETIRAILQPHDSPTVRVVRLHAFDRAALRLLNEYYEAVNVVQRDSVASLLDIISDSCSGMWIAYFREQPVGCVVLRKLESIPAAGECKRLYVQAHARGHHIADALLDTLEAYARSQNLQWIYLDSYDALKPAIALYKKHGYSPHERYNDNPQATIFLCKDIRSEA